MKFHHGTAFCTPEQQAEFTARLVRATPHALDVLSSEHDLDIKKVLHATENEGERLSRAIAEAVLALRNGHCAPTTGRFTLMSAFTLAGTGPGRTIDFFVNRGGGLKLIEFVEKGVLPAWQPSTLTMSVRQLAPPRDEFGWTFLDAAFDIVGQRHETMRSLVDALIQKGVVMTLPQVEPVLAACDGKLLRAPATFFFTRAAAGSASPITVGSVDPGIREDEWHLNFWEIQDVTRRNHLCRLLAANPLGGF